MTDYHFRVLGPGDDLVLSRVAPDVFDAPPRPELVREFLDDPRHHLAVALHDGTVVGFASGFHYVHPDKPATLFVNEVGVAPQHRQRGVARAVMQALFVRARSLGCREAWVGTEHENLAARKLYIGTAGLRAESNFVLYEFDLAQDAAASASTGR